ncbi:unnamed protein product, partial [Medioppia subpectinata]
QLSDGQRCRVVFAWLSWQVPHLLLMDEPTNHLDIETIDALADAIKDFEGGMVLVSHDFRLISQVAEEIWVCEKGTTTKWNGTIQTYKEHLRKKPIMKMPVIIEVKVELGIGLRQIETIIGNKVLDSSIQQVLTRQQSTTGQFHCPPEGIYAYEHPKACEQYYLCTNGTLTHEFCPNGLAHAIDGAVYGFCAYHWKVDCKDRTLPDPISTHGCPYQFGIFNEGDPNVCNIYFSECLWGIPERKECQKGLFYDDRIKGCNWPDKVGCSSDNLLGFSCPHEDKTNKYYPFPRYFYNNHAIITCVDNNPRLINCGDEELVSPALTCEGIHKEETLSKPRLAPIHRF